MSSNAFLQTVNLSNDDVWNGDGRAVGRIRKMMDAVRDLPATTTPEQAQILYWCIDNVAVIQGSLLPAGPKILPALLDGLFRATETSRPYVLQAIYQIANGRMPPTSWSIHEREHIESEMIRMVEGALRYFMYLAVHGSDEDAAHALDLISLILTAPNRMLISTVSDEQDLHVLLEALRIQHPDRHHMLVRNISG